MRIRIRDLECDKTFGEILYFNGGNSNNITKIIKNGQIMK